MRIPGPSSGDLASPACPPFFGATVPGSLVFFYSSPNPGLTFCRESAKNAPAGIWDMVALLLPLKPPNANL